MMFVSLKWILFGVVVGFMDMLSKITFVRDVID